MTTTEDGRIGRIEGVLEEVRTRLNNLENRVSALESRVDTRFTSLESRIQTQFYWLLGVVLGVLIPMWVTIILAVVLRT